MKLLRVGDIILNMEQLIAVKDVGNQMVVFFAGSSSTTKILSVTLNGRNSELLRIWLGRIGVNDLSKETPTFIELNW